MTISEHAQRSEIALQRALGALVFGPDPSGLSAEAFRAWCERHDVDPEDATALFEQRSRLGVYRRLVRGNLEETIRLMIPRTRARLGDAFEGHLDRFLAERGPRTHCLRDVTREFLDFCEPHWARDPGVPEYLIELARHELLRVSVGAAPEVAAGPLLDVDLDRGLRFDAAACLSRHRFAVHELSEDVNDTREPPRRPTALFVYRDTDYEVRYLETSPLATGVLEALLRGETLRRAVIQACAELELELTASVQQGVAQLLSDLAARGVLLGASDD